MPVSLRQSIGREEDENLNAEMTVESEKRLDRERWVNNGLEEYSESRRIKIEFVFADPNCYMEEVVEDNGQNGESFEDGSVFLIQLVQAQM